MSTSCEVHGVLGFMCNDGCQTYSRELRRNHSHVRLLDLPPPLRVRHGPGAPVSTVWEAPVGITKITKIVSPGVLSGAEAKYRLTLSGSELVVLIEALERATWPWVDQALVESMQAALTARHQKETR
jgi:hypothetical protein